jgi:cytochrome P450
MSSVVEPNSFDLPLGGAAESKALPISRVNIVDFSRDMIGNFRRLHQQHGPIAAIEDGGTQIVFLFSPEYNQQVLSDTERFHARFFPIRGPKRSAQRRVTNGLLSMNGDQHRRNRRIVKEPFGLRAVSTYGQAVNHLTEEMLGSWRVGEVRDIAEEMRQYMLRVTSTILFGLEDPASACRLGDMIANWVTLNQEIGEGALVPSERFLGRYEELLSYAEVLETEVMAMIRDRRERRSQGNDVLSILVRTHDDEGALTDEELVGQAAVLFSAAHMTTAHSLTWILFLLAQHPTVMRDLWQELSAVHDPSATGKGPKSLGSLPKGDELSLLDRVIKESMRVLPASAYSQRMTTEGVQLGPLYLARGTAIVFTPLIVHHLAALYPEPERFIPDRWIDLRPSPYAYHPFGAGPRLCIGAPLATAIIRVALEGILTRFRLKVVPGSDIGAHVESTMLFPTNAVPMEIHATDGQYSSSPIVGNVRELLDLTGVPTEAFCTPLTAR